MAKSATTGPPRKASIGRWRPALIVVAATVAVAGSVASLAMAVAASDAEGRATQDRRALDLHDVRTELGWVHFDLLVAGLVGEQRGTVPPARFDELLDRRADLVDELDAMADPEGDDTARTAAALVDVLAEIEVDRWPVDASELEHFHFESMPFSDQIAFGGPEQLADAGAIAMLPLLVLVDALAVDLSTSAEPVPEWAAEFVDYTYEIVVDAPGWFGPDRDRPLDENVVTWDRSGPGGVPEVDAAADRALSDLQLVWDYDEWLIEGGPDAGPPPSTLADLNDASVRATAELRGGVREAIADTRGAAASGPSRSNAWLVAGAVLAVAAVALVAIQIRIHGRRRRLLAQAAYTDPLTGANNRRFLDEVVAARCREAGRRHVVAMLDMDRFKMVNDTWGHDAGDALLRLLSGQLKDRIDALCDSLPQSTGAVVRLGGDEFAVTLHAPPVLDLEIVESRIRGVAGEVDLGLDEPVELAFSLGVASSDEPCDVADLIKIADLAAYGDKRKRSSPPPVADLRTAAMPGGPPTGGPADPGNPVS